MGKHHSVALSTTKGTRDIDGHLVRVFTREVVDACMLKMSVGTEGTYGEDGDYLATVISFEDIDAILRPSVSPDKRNVVITMNGNRELTCMIDLLEWAVKVLKAQSVNLDRVAGVDKEE